MSGERRRDDVQFDVDGVSLDGVVTVPSDPMGIVIFAHGSGSSRHSPRNVGVAEVLHGGGFATVLFDLLTAEEATDRGHVFDIEMLARRLGTVTTTIASRVGLGTLPIGYFGASTGAAAALWAAGSPESGVRAVVSRGGRPDLAEARLDVVRAPTLCIVGSEDTAVLELNRRALRQMHCERRLEVIPGATHLFAEPGTLQRAATSASAWFGRYLRPFGAAT